MVLDVRGEVTMYPILGGATELLENLNWRNELSARLSLAILIEDFNTELLYLFFWGDAINFWFFNNESFLSSESLRISIISSTSEKCIFKINKYFSIFKIENSFYLSLQQ